MYQLVLRSSPSGDKRDVGDEVLFDSLPQDYPIYLIYYPAAVLNLQLESELRRLGEATGKNLFVSIGRLTDRSYPAFRARFGVERNPVLIMTARADLAAPANSDVNVFARIDSERLLGSPTMTRACAEQLFNLFLDGDVARAMTVVGKFERKAVAQVILDKVFFVLKGVTDFISARDVSISFLEGRLEIKRSSGQ